MSSRPSTALRCHPAAACPALAGFAVSVDWLARGALSLTFRLTGAMAALRIPAPQAAGPADLLWQHTCCEAFIAVAGRPAYREFNFSPSGQWAIYDFADYRQRLDLSPPDPPPVLTVHRRADGLELAVILDPALLPAAVPGTRLHLGLAGVVEAADGGKSYWALAHTEAQPDFHRQAAFRLDLTVPDTTQPDRASP